MTVAAVHADARRAAADVAAAILAYRYRHTDEERLQTAIAEALHLKRMQQEPLVDPDAKLFEEATPSDRVRLLAERVMQTRRREPVA